MKSIMRKIDRYCLTHPNFGISNLMLYIAIGNVAVWLLMMMDTTGSFYSAICFNARAIFTKGQIWRLVTFVFIPNGAGILTMALSAYFYYFVGSTLEIHWGKGKFTIYYLCGVLMNVVVGVLAWLIFKINISLNATYLNFSLFFAFATLFPDTYVMLFFLIPIKIKWLGILDAVFFVLAIITTRFPMNLLPVIAIANYLLFCGGWLFDYFKPKRVEQRQKTVNFKNAAREYNRKQAAKPYNRKCEVCGKTDTEYPDLEFRFCSRCEGYHCFCIDHINSHIHFKE